MQWKHIDLRPHCASFHKMSWINDNAMFFRANSVFLIAVLRFHCLWDARLASHSKRKSTFFRISFPSKTFSAAMYCKQQWRGTILAQLSDLFLCYPRLLHSSYGKNWPYDSKLSKYQLWTQKNSTIYAQLLNDTKTLKLLTPKTVKWNLAVKIFSWKCSLKSEKLLNQ